METLSRGIEPFWMNDKDADVAGISDNDWVEIYNDHGVVATRACVSARIPRGMGMIYHAPERTLTVPKSKERGNRRAGEHNSLTRASGTAVHDRGLRAVHVRLQLLGPDGRQPRHVCGREANGEGELVSELLRLSVLA